MKSKNNDKRKAKKGNAFINWFKKKKSMEQKNQAEELEQEELKSMVEEAQNEGDMSKKEEQNLSPEEKLLQENQDLKIQVSDLKDKYLRLHAEFDNSRKRNVKEKLELMKTAARDTMSVLLPVLDDFDRAKKSAEGEFSEGIQLVYNKLFSVLEQKGLKAMETEEVAFDPELHEALTEIPAPSEDLKGKIVDTIERGYYLNDVIIRHAKVVVGK